MLNNLSKYAHGDRGIWILIALMAIASFLSVYSASGNIAFVYGKVTTTSLLVKHAMHLMIGGGILWLTHRLPHRYFAPLSLLLMPVAIALLFATLTSGTEIGNANASRWLRIPFLGLSFQTSALAGLVLLVFLARALSKRESTYWTSKKAIWELFLPMLLVLGLVLPANFSTAGLIFISCLVLLIVGGLPNRQIVVLLGSGLAGLLLFILVVLAFPNISNRVDTWKARIENFGSGDQKDNYQVEKAKMAIGSGGITGAGPGKSVQKNFLPQSSSDFIYAIIVEEYGLVGGIVVMAFYMLLWFRFIRIANRSKSLFGSLVVIGAGFSLTFQALINMAVAVNLVPVTGQTLPLLSAGGSSIWMTCLALGMILSVSRANEESAEENVQAEKMPDELKMNT